MSANGRVETIHWDEDVLSDGFLDHDDWSVELYWVPREIIEFHAVNLRIEGTINTSTLPRGLTRLNINENIFYGTFAMEFAPTTMTYMEVYHNEFDGTLNMSALPRSIKIFEAGINQFSGSVDLLNLPDALRCLGFYGNRFSGEINLQTLSPLLREISLSRNDFRQEVLVIGGLYQVKRLLNIERGKFRKVVHASGKPLAILDRGNTRNPVLTRVNRSPGGSMLTCYPLDLLDAYKQVAIVSLVDVQGICITLR